MACEDPRLEVDSPLDTSEPPPKDGWDGVVSPGGTVTSLAMMKLSLEAGSSAATPGYLTSHQGALPQLQKTGLVRRCTERLEKLAGLWVNGLHPGAAFSVPEQMDTSSSDAVEDMEVELGLSPEADARPPSAPPGPSGEPLKGMSRATSSPLTRSSSSDSLRSDSLRSVRGQPGLVRQRTQEIEARLRLAGLTVPSHLKRSSSLAKLGGLTFSEEELSSACAPSDTSAPLLSPEPGGSWDWQRDWAILEKEVALASLPPTNPRS